MMVDDTKFSVVLIVIDNNMVVFIEASETNAVINPL